MEKIQKLIKKLEALYCHFLGVAISGFAMLIITVYLIEPDSKLGLIAIFLLIFGILGKEIVSSLIKSENKKIQIIENLIEGTGKDST